MLNFLILVGFGRRVNPEDHTNPRKQLKLTYSLSKMELPPQWLQLLGQGCLPEMEDTKTKTWLCLSENQTSLSLSRPLVFYWSLVQSDLHILG